MNSPSNICSNNNFVNNSDVNSRQTPTSVSTPLVWSIGGVDPTALAGISADNRAIALSGAHGVNIVTSVTAQNSNAFFTQHEIPIDVLEQQWIALSEQCKSLVSEQIAFKPMVIKIGLLVSVEQVKWLGDKLCSLKQELKKKQGKQELNNSVWVIYDPVLRASSDSDPVVDNMLTAIKSYLLPSVDLLTPNLPEALLLTKGLFKEPSQELVKDLLIEQPKSQESLSEFTIALSNAFNCQVLLKGGHVDDVFNQASDHKESSQQWCFDYYARCDSLKDTRYVPEPAHEFVIRQPYSDNENRRGSGCILASLIAGFVANNYTFCDAIFLSNGVMNKTYQQAQPLGTARGGALKLSLTINYQDLPVIDSFNSVVIGDVVDNADIAYASCPDQLGLYPVVDSVEWLERLLKQGVRTIQLRIKEQVNKDIEDSIITAISLGKAFDARVFINDFWSLAIKHNAYGVHLGQEDLHSADLNAIKNAGLRLGLSTHGIFEAQWASQFSPSYMAIGHIYATQTKDMPSRPQGLEKLYTQVAIFDTKLPLVAIGGITANRVNEVVQSNIGSVALVTAITKASNPDEVTQTLLALVGQGDSHE